MTIIKRVTHFGADSLETKDIELDLDQIAMRESLGVLHGQEVEQIVLASGIMLEIIKP